MWVRVIKDKLGDEQVHDFIAQSKPLPVSTSSASVLLQDIPGKGILLGLPAVSTKNIKPSSEFST